MVQLARYFLPPLGAVLGGRDVVVHISAVERASLRRLNEVSHDSRIFSKILASFRSAVSKPSVNQP